MKKFIFTVVEDSAGYHSVITRVKDGLQKYFFQCSGAVEGISKFYSSMTDEQAEGYFPKPGKQTANQVDNYVFLGYNEGRDKALALASEQLVPAQMSAVADKLANK